MILFVSSYGESLPLARRLTGEGIEAAVYIHSPGSRRNYQGMVKTVNVKGLSKAVRDSEAVIFDIVQPNRKTKEDAAFLKTFGLRLSSPSVFGPVADKLKKDIRVLGASAWCDETELDREAGFKVAEKIGLRVPETHKFNTFAAGVKFLDGSKDLWVFKPHGNLDLDLTYVEKFPGDLAAKMKNQFPARIGADKVTFSLQKQVKGVEISTEGWFDGKSWAMFNHTIEDKRLMAGGLGRHVGSQGNTVWGKKNETGLLCRELKALTPYLKSAGYVGPVDINVIVSEQDRRPYFLEFTPRFGYDALYCLLSLYPGKLKEFFAGNWSRELSGFACSQRVSVPPYPYATAALLRESRGAVVGADTIGNPDFWPQDVRGEDGEFETAGADGIVGVMTGRGRSLGESIGRLYRNLKRMRIGADVQYRTDGGKRADGAIKTLQEWGHEIF